MGWAKHREVPDVERKDAAYRQPLGHCDYYRIHKIYVPVSISSNHFRGAGIVRCLW